MNRTLLYGAVFSVLTAVAAIRTDALADPDSGQGAASKADTNKAKPQSADVAASGSKSDDEKAIERYAEAIRRNPKDVRAYFDRAELFEKQQEFGKAIADYSEAIKLLAPTDRWAPYAYGYRGDAYRAEGSLDEAISDYTEAIRISRVPTKLDFYTKRGHAYRQQRDFNKAIADYTQVISQMRDPRVFQFRAFVYQDKGQYDDAIADLTTAIAIKPGREISYIHRGDAYERIGDHDRAIADYTRAIQLEPRDVRAYVGRGVAYQKKGEGQKAQTDFATAQKLGNNAVREEKGDK